MRNKIIVTIAIAIGTSVPALAVVSADSTQQAASVTTVQTAQGAVFVQDAAQGGDLQPAGWVEQ